MYFYCFQIRIFSAKWHYERACVLILFSMRVNNITLTFSGRCGCGKTLSWCGWYWLSPPARYCYSRRQSLIPSHRWLRALLWWMRCATTSGATIPLTRTGEILRDATTLKSANQVQLCLSLRLQIYIHLICASNSYSADKNSYSSLSCII